MPIALKRQGEQGGAKFVIDRAVRKTVSIETPLQLILETGVSLRIDSVLLKV